MGGTVTLTPGSGGGSGSGSAGNVFPDGSPLDNLGDSVTGAVEETWGDGTAETAATAFEIAEVRYPNKSAAELREMGHPAAARYRIEQQEGDNVVTRQFDGVPGGGFADEAAGLPAEAAKAATPDWMDWFIDNPVTTAVGLGLGYLFLAAGGLEQVAAAGGDDGGS